MLLSPLQNTATLENEIWIQKRPHVTQEFGKNPDIYRQFGLKGHNGIDYRAKVGTPLYAPCDGFTRYRKDSNGYGWHVRIRSQHSPKEIVIGHMLKFPDKIKGEVNMGDLIGYSGNTGFSTGPHVHYGFRILLESDSNVWKWSVINYGNGYYGYIDPAPYTINWKGTHNENTL